MVNQAWEVPGRDWGSLRGAVLSRLLCSYPAPGVSRIRASLQPAGSWGCSCARSRRFHGLSREQPLQRQAPGHRSSAGAAGTGWLISSAHTRAVRESRSANPPEKCAERARAGAAAAGLGWGCAHTRTRPTAPAPTGSTPSCRFKGKAASGA